MTMPRQKAFLRHLSKRKCISRSTNLLPMQRRTWQYSSNRCIIPKDSIPVEAICLLLSLKLPTFQCREVDFPRVRQNGFTPVGSTSNTSALTHQSSISYCSEVDL